MCMRNVLAGAILTGICLMNVACSVPAPEKTTYDCLVEVVRVGENDLVSAISVDGHIWEFYADGIEVGNELELRIDHNNTIDLCDDVVVAIIE